MYFQTLKTTATKEGQYIVSVCIFFAVIDDAYNLSSVALIFISEGHFFIFWLD